ncbi:hypothetical protein SmJEL517_g03734 [Synchytrium microbalum]|uniref:mRNA export factor GLE1 n=1 Tax=Synchytrium microbalum TaxID=1806994 RepID=A0A507C5P6_9FUNG|nr:uncharacterized protein SmJEL517_g03734 [Synchytrium microbalum]TPX33296.1 hypothetical protein SmJEL517_g03734 [Synchytrium microbalum]
MRFGLIDDTTDDEADSIPTNAKSRSSPTSPSGSPSKSRIKRDDRLFLKAVKAHAMPDPLQAFEAVLSDQAWRAVEAKASVTSNHVNGNASQASALSKDDMELTKKLAEMSLQSQQRVADRQAQALAKSKTLKDGVEKVIRMTQDILAAQESKIREAHEQKEKDKQAKANALVEEARRAQAVEQQALEQQQAAALQAQQVEAQKQQQLEAERQARQQAQRAQAQQQNQAPQPSAASTVSRPSSASVGDRSTPSAIAAAQPFLELVTRIKTQVKPELLSNLQNRNTFFQHKMMMARKVTVVKNSKAKVLEVGRELSRELDVGKSSSSQMYEVLMYKLARKITRQAELEVADNPAFSFPLAFVAIIVMVKHEPFIRVLLGHLMRRCPYVVPRYVEKFKGQSEEEYRKEAGYLKTDENEYESETKYVRRMCGIIYLYAAIVATPHPKNPHPISNGWTWLARMVNIKPRAITPHLLHAFLKIVGNRLLQTYGTQAIKLVQLIRDQVVPAVPKDSQDALAASNHLLVFFERVERDGTIPAHEGSEWELPQ